MALFRDMVCYQEEVRDPARVAEVLNRVISKAKRLSAPAQINIPRDFWTQIIDISLPAIVEFERPAGGTSAVAEAAKLLSAAKFPVILSGAGVVLGNAIPECAALAERLDAPVCSNYQHNNSRCDSGKTSRRPRKRANGRGCRDLPREFARLGLLLQFLESELDIGDALGAPFRSLA